jgi:D-tagatose-1,6-bisphosphate aldolase subunit GatZ/KbaZ
MTPGRNADSRTFAQQEQIPQSHDSSTRLRDVLHRNRVSRKGGAYAVCSAHPQVIGAAIQQSIEDGSVLHVESTSSQVNQFGGYTGQTPRQFAHYVRSAAQTAGLPAERVLLGGDHLGPFPWRGEASSAALEKASQLVRDCVLAGYLKIHLDASMPCADDRAADFTETKVAERAALLCDAAEKAYAELPSGSPQIVYVVGTEVPAPGGESVDTHAPAITAAEHVHRTLASFRQAFEKRGLFSAWQRVIALVVQPGVDFGSETIFDYDRSKARLLSAALSDYPAIVYEAHSTDYQSAQSLAEMVEDHFAILKVGPWLTFAFREAILGLTAIEREMLTGKGSPLSQVRGALENAMLRNAIQWQSYYHGNEEEIHRQMIYSYSDRCRYYWHEPSVQEEIGQLFKNLGAAAIPPTLVSQFLPLEYDAVRSGQIQATPEALIQEHISHVLWVYAHACAR